MTKGSDQGNVCPESSNPGFSGSRSTEGTIHTSNSKSRYIIQRLHDIRRQHRELQATPVNRRRSSSGGANGDRAVLDPRKPKVIVFSEHRRSLNTVGHDLYLHFGDDAIAEFWGKHRDLAIRKFKTDTEEVWRCEACGFQNDTTTQSCHEIFLTVLLAANGQMHKCKAINAVEYFTGRTMVLNEVLTIRGLGAARLLKYDICRKKRTDTCQQLTRNLDCFVLLLSRDGSLGLDLSFATHIVLLEKIWDTAVEDQVVARAYRMGATHPVHVEQLIMEGSVEEVMHSQFGASRGLPGGGGGANSNSNSNSNSSSGFGSGSGSGSGSNSSSSSNVHSLRGNRNGHGTTTDKQARRKLQYAMRHLQLCDVTRSSSSGSGSGSGNGEEENPNQAVVELHEMIQEQRSEQELEAFHNRMEDVWSDGAPSTSTSTSTSTAVTTENGQSNSSGSASSSGNGSSSARVRFSAGPTVRTFQGQSPVVGPNCGVNSNGTSTGIGTGSGLVSAESSSSNSNSSGSNGSGSASESAGTSSATSSTSADQSRAKRVRFSEPE